MANRITLKELSELLASEVENGNGDAYIFVGEYYITKDKYIEQISNDFGKSSKTHDNPFIMYMDSFTKEKIMAMNYQHVQKLTDEENIELEKQIKAEENKKMLKSKKSVPSYTANNRYGTINVEPAFYGNYGFDRQEVRDEPIVDRHEVPIEAPVNEVNEMRDDVVNAQVQEAPIQAENQDNVGEVRINGRSQIREYINRLEQELNLGRR